MEEHQQVDEALRHAFGRYQVATGRAQELREPGPAATAARAELRRARIALCHALEVGGWEPPTQVRCQVLFDEEQLDHVARRAAVPRPADSVENASGGAVVTSSSSG